MISDKSHIKYSDLLIDYLDGTTSDSETAEVESWIAESKENKAFFEEITRTWDNDVPLVEVDSALNKFYDRIEKRKGKITEKTHEPIPLHAIREVQVEKQQNKQTKVFSLKFITQIAAVLMMGIGIGYVWNNMSTTPDTGVIADASATPDETVTSVPVVEIASTDQILDGNVLPDGSIMHLQKNSSISYPETFDGEIRSVTLNEGAVFCEVEHKMNDAVFLVHAGNTTVQVVGTKFLVEKKPNGDVSVFVEEGLVVVYKNDEQIKQVLVRKGEKAVSKVDTEGVTVMHNDDLNIMSWHSRDLTFQRMKMSEVVKLMSTVYNTNIKIEQEEILEYELTAKFDDATAVEVLFYIGEIFNLEVKKEDDSFLIFTR
jgi:transmembrane sensor